MIFEDPTGRRWRRTQRIAMILAVVGVGVVADAAFGTFVTPKIASADIVPQTSQSREVSGEPLNVPGALLRPSHGTGESQTGPRSFASLPFVHAAFVQQDEPPSVASLRKHIAQLQVVMPDWLTFDAADGSMTHKVQPALASLLKTSGVQVMPRIANTDAKGNWSSDHLGELFNDKAATDKFTANLLAFLGETGADGVNFDIELLKPGQHRAYASWLAEVIGAMHAKGFSATVDLPMSDSSFDLTAIANAADAVVLMAYDQHWAGTEPGPVAGNDWYRSGVAEAAKHVPANKLIMGVGAYGYDWTEGKPTGDTIDFRTAMEFASAAGQPVVSAGSDVNAHFDYTDTKKQIHHVWLLDAVSAWNQYRTAVNAGTRGAALFRTGTEEPSLWNFFGTNSGKPFDPYVLTKIITEAFATYQGDGELLRVDSGMTNGQREITVKDGAITAASIIRPPRLYEVHRFGKLDEKLIALTFDDGPDAEWTPQVLAELAKHKTPATFFVIGNQVERFPSIVQATVAAGHLLGNHTFTHPDLKKTPLAVLRDELNATQRTIQAVTGRSTILFRSPFDIEPDPSTIEQLAPIHLATDMGYVFAAADIDTFDYLHPSSDHIVAHVLAHVTDGKSHVVLMHDGGGNRKRTIDALAKLIPALQAEGYTFVTLGTLMGAAPDKMMPSVAMTERPFMLGAALETYVRGDGWLYGWNALEILFTVTTLIAVGRFALLGTLIWFGARKRKAANNPPIAFTGPVRVLVPAHNEEKVILRTLETLLTSDYPNMAITVIDDGSKDNTANLVRQFAAAHPQVHLIAQANTGKAEALNNAFRRSPEDIVVTIDADTIIYPDTIRLLVAPFADPTIDAVCGNVKVGNIHNMLTAFQNVEYVTSQNYDRLAFDTINAISVVPGATGAWKRRKVLEAGGYSGATLTEDADLTLEMLARGSRIVFAPHAQSATEVPETVHALFKQRFRWCFGTYQSLWKHRGNFNKGTLGWVVLPNILLFQILLPLLAPVGDGILLLFLFRGLLAPIAVGYLMFLVLDVIVALTAFRLEQRKPVSALVILVQRFYYRQFLYIVTFAALLAVLRGGRRGWNKLERTGSVAVPIEAAQPA